MIKQDFWRIRKYALIPIIIVCVFMPVTAWQLKKTAESFSQGVPLMEIMKNSQVWSSFFILWWPFFIIKEYIEGDGSELLYTSKRSRNLISPVLFCTAVYLAMVGLVMILYTVKYGEIILYNYIIIIFISIFYIGIFFFLSFVMKSTVFPVMIIFIMHIFTAIFTSRRRDEFSFFVEEFPVPATDVIIEFLWMPIVGIILLVLGAVINKKYRGVLS